MTETGTAYVSIALTPGSAKHMATEMAAELRRFAEYLDAYDEAVGDAEDDDR